jgi:hypothetical protein
MVQKKEGLQAEYEYVRRYYMRPSCADRWLSGKSDSTAATRCAEPNRGYESAK